MKSVPRITVSIVTFNSAEHLKDCFESLMEQRGVSLEIIVVDNMSRDSTMEILAQYQKKSEKMFASFTTIKSTSNTGYGGGHNTAIRLSKLPYVFLMNPDAVLHGERCLHSLVDALEKDPQASSAGPRIFLKEKIDHLDSTGLLISSSRRVIDRDKEEKDAGQHSQSERVFGVTGATVLFRRTSLFDCSQPRRGGGVEYFDEDFFMYKEDVDIAWRLNNLGWRQLYVAGAHVIHGRSTRGRAEDQGLARGIELRGKIDPRMLEYSFRNHRLMMIKKERFMHVIRDVVIITWREVLFFGYLLLRERSTLKAYWGIIKLAPRAIRLHYYNKHRWRVSWRDTAQLFVSSKFLFWKSD